jgi:quinol monooxygenase YgiN
MNERRIFMRAQRAVTVFFENWKSKDALKAAV